MLEKRQRVSNWDKWMAEDAAKRKKACTRVGIQTIREAIQRELKAIYAEQEGIRDQEPACVAWVVSITCPLSLSVAEALDELLKGIEDGSGEPGSREEVG